MTGGEVPSGRSSAAMAVVGSKLYVFGGLSRDCGWLNDMHAFDTGELIYGHDCSTTLGVLQAIW